MSKCDCGKCLSCDLERLRAYPAKWKQLEDPLAAVEAIRNGEDYNLDEWLARKATNRGNDLDRHEDYDLQFNEDGKA